MEHGVLGDPGVHAMTRLERRKEQDTVITHHLKMEVPHVLALQVMKLPAKVPNLLIYSLLFKKFMIKIPE